MTTFDRKVDNMSDFIEKYINPFTDYGFKRPFGEEPSKELLLDFSNELLKNEQGRITKLNYLKSDRLGSSEHDRKAVFDLYCENEKGERSSSLNFRRQNRSSSKTELSTLRLFRFGNKHSEAQTGL